MYNIHRRLSTVESTLLTECMHVLVQSAFLAWAGDGIDLYVYNTTSSGLKFTSDIANQANIYLLKWKIQSFFFFLFCFVIDRSMI